MNTNKLTNNLLRQLLLIFPALLAALILSACANRGEVRITEGTEPIGEASGSSVLNAKEASIVHVNLTGRLATIRKGDRFETGAFLITKTREGRETGVLKALPKRPLGLRTADVLEGNPGINDIVTRASESQAERFAKIYRDPEE